MTNTEKQETSAQTAQPPQEFKLVPPRPKPKTGIPTDGVWIIVGLPKGGKTTLAASIPGCVLLELERGGADRIDGWVQDIPDLETFRLALKAAVENPAVKAVAIDSIDIFNDWAEMEIAEKFGLDNISERKEGVNSFEVWKMLRTRYEGLISYLKRSKKLALLVAHSKEVKIDDGGKVVIPAGISIPGKLGSYIAAEADAIGNVFKKQVGSVTVYYLSFQGGSLGVYGSRIPELEDKVIALPRANQWAAVEAIFKTPAPGKTEQQKDDKKPAAKAKGDK